MQVFLESTFVSAFYGYAKFWIHSKQWKENSGLLLDHQKQFWLKIKIHY